MISQNELLQDPTVQDWFKSINRRPETQRAYLNGLVKYINFTGLTPDDLLSEAEEESMPRVNPRDNIPLRKRKIHTRRTDFRDFLQKSGASENTVNTAMVAVKSFYRMAVDPVPDLLGNQKPRMVKANNKFITKEEIHELLKVCDPLEKAVVLVGISSGLSAIDICNLKVKDFKQGYDPETGITMLSLRRHKTNIDFTTFLSREATQAVCDYLNYYRDRKPAYRSQESKDQAAKQSVTSDDGYLFILRKIPKAYRLDHKPEEWAEMEEHRKFKPNTFARMYLTLAEKAQKINPDGWNVVRSHNMRKYFFSTLRKNHFDRAKCEHLMGHAALGNDEHYDDFDPEKLKEFYLLAEPYITIDKESVFTKEMFESLNEDVEKLKAEKVAAMVERYELKQQQEWIEEQQRQIDELKSQLSARAELQEAWSSPEGFKQLHLKLMQTDPKYRKTIDDMLRSKKEVDKKEVKNEW